jgi:hypothetical protein
VRLALLVLAGCGRIGFDPVAVGDGGAGDAVLGPFAQRAYIKASNADADDQLDSVALSADGTTLVATAPLEASAATGVDGNQADNSASGAGAGYVFVRNGGAWTQQAYLKTSSTAAGDTLGESVAVSADGSTVALGASSRSSQTGEVDVFVRSGTTWTQQAELVASNAETFDSFGCSVALSADGNTLVVGAYGEDSNATGVDGNQADNSVASSGAAYVFERSGTTWTQPHYLKASNPDTADLFGVALAISADGSTIAVAAREEASAATGIDGNQADNSAAGAGAVYVFVRGASWTQQAYVKATDTHLGDQFGFRVGLSADGSTLAVGANLASPGGAAYIYTRSGTTWAPQARLVASNADANDEFGIALALSGDGGTLAVAANAEASAATGIDGNQADNSASSAGAVYLFQRAGTAWTQQHYIKASNTDAGDFFGDNVALSADGGSLAVGAPFEASAARGIDGDQLDNSSARSGAVYVFR